MGETATAPHLDRSRYVEREEYDRACQTIAAMHAVATRFTLHRAAAQPAHPDATSW